MEANQMKHIPGQFMLISLSVLCVLFAIQTSHAGNDTPTINELGNASYSGIEDGPVTLSDGSWEGKPYSEDSASRPRVGLVEDIHFTGDLDGDGKNEAVAFLWQNTGGTGNYIHIAVMSNENGTVRNRATALAGDRVKLIGGEISDGTVVLEVLQGGETDAMCCPTMLATRRWTLDAGQLKEGVIEKTGALSLSMLDGSEWKLSQLERGKPIDKKIEVTLTFAGDRISGKSACNRYSAGIQEGANAGDVKIGQSMGTMMACPEELMAVEQKYMDTLSKVTGFSFSAGKLMLNGTQGDGAPVSMLFARAVTDNP
jgi:heat shock protein HslJ